MCTSTSSRAKTNYLNEFLKLLWNLGITAFSWLTAQAATLESTTLVKQHSKEFCYWVCLSEGGKLFVKPLDCRQLLQSPRRNFRLKLRLAYSTMRKRINGTQ
jgi:hypothetical protein